MRTRTAALVVVAGLLGYAGNAKAQSMSGTGYGPLYTMPYQAPAATSPSMTGPFNPTMTNPGRPNPSMTSALRPNPTMRGAGSGAVPASTFVGGYNPYAGYTPYSAGSYAPNAYLGYSPPTGYNAAQVNNSFVWPTMAPGFNTFPTGDAGQGFNVTQFPGGNSPNMNAPNNNAANTNRPYVTYPTLNVPTVGPTLGVPNTNTPNSPGTNVPNPNAPTVPNPTSPFGGNGSGVIPGGIPTPGNPNH